MAFQIITQMMDITYIYIYIYIYIYVYMHIYITHILKFILKTIKYFLYIYKMFNTYYQKKTKKSFKKK